MDFNIRLSSLTGGKGKVKFDFSGYQDCPNGESKKREFKDINPLDESNEYCTSEVLLKAMNGDYNWQI